MKKVLVVFSFLFLALSTISTVQAQEALTQTFTASDGSYSLMYPAGWEFVSSGANRAVVSHRTASATLTGNILVTPTGGATLPDALKKAFPVGEVTIIQSGGRDVARAEVGGLGVVYAVAAGDQVVVGLFAGSADLIKDVDVTLLAMMTSVQAGGGNGGGAAVSTVVVSPAAATEAAVAAPAVISTVQARPVVNGVSGIAFPGEDVAHSNIFITDLSGQAVTQLTHEPLNTLLPSWSPDGTMIAYISNTSATGPDAYDVFVIPSNGGEAHKVSSVSSSYRGALAWSPDSSQLIFLATRDQGNGSQIYRVNADGSGEEKLAIDAQAINDLVLDWSPDGTQIALMGYLNSDVGYAILIANADGSNLTPIPNLNVMQVGEYFKWSPDGQQALISDATSLTVAAADGSAPQVIVDPSANLAIGGVSWSPDGTQIAFTASGADGALFLYTISPDGTNEQKLDLGGQEVIWGGLSWGVLPATMAAPAALPTTAASNSSTSTCTVTATRAVNLRGGPGTTFARAGSLAAGTSQSVVGQANGSDDFVWWKLDSGSWVRSDLVQTGGDCTSVPTVGS